MSKKVSLVIPCYNEEKNISLFYKECEKSFTKSSKNYELIFINDGSKDNTITELKKLLNYHKFEIKIINFSRNFGKEAAMYAGLKNATGDYVCIIDADLQQHPSLLNKMVETLDEDENYDCVCYYQEERIEGKIISFLKKNFYKIITKISEIDFVNGASDFRMFRKNMVNSILALSEHNRFSKGIFSWVGFNTCYIPYVPDERANGVSSFNFKSLMKYAMSGILSFSSTPLKIATHIGILSTLISIVYLIIILFRKIFLSISVPKFGTIVGILFLIGGLILISLGIIGEYIARIYTEVRNRPIYISKEILSNEEDKK